MTPPPSPSEPCPQAPQTPRPRARLNQRLNNELAVLDASSMRRSLRALPSAGKRVVVDGCELLNLAGNDYLGLADHPKLKQAATAAIAQYGVGSGASRLVAGHLDIHAQAEAGFAAFKHAESALLFPTGYMANLAVLTTLPQPGDLICQDKLNHASLIDAAKFSDAEVRTYPHTGHPSDHAKLERLLRNHYEKNQGGKLSGGIPGGIPGGRWIVTDSVFSMDGDVADLPVLCALAERYDAALVVDEAHGTGVLGEAGTGLAELQGVAGRVTVAISTASKALGGLGGMVTADRAVIETLVNRGRPMIYTTAVPAAQAAAINAAIDIVRDEPWRRKRLDTLSQAMRTRLSEAGWRGLAQAVATPIVPLVTGSVASALALEQRLRAAGILAVAIRPPTVTPGAARVRLSLRADFSDDELDAVVHAVGRPAPDNDL